MPHRRAQLLLPRLRRRVDARPGLSTPAPSVRPRSRRSRDQAREYTVVPVWREVLADLETPLSAFVKLVGDREGFLLESVEHAERWGRFSFLGRDPALTFVARGRQLEWIGGVAARGRPLRPGNARRARRAAGAVPRARRKPSCRRFTAASSAGWATTPCARSNGSPTFRTDDLGLARRGVLARRAGRRVRPLPPALLPHRERVSRARLRRRRRCAKHYDAAVERLADAVADSGRPLPYAAVAARRPTSSPSCPRCATNLDRRAVDRGGRGREGAHPRRRHLPGRARAALRSASSRSTRSSVYRVLRLVNPSPYMYFLRHPGGDDRRFVARADGAGARRPGDQPPDRGHPAPRAARPSTTNASRPSWSSTRRSGPST